MADAPGPADVFCSELLEDSGMAADNELSDMSNFEIATMLAIATHLELSGTIEQRHKAVGLLPLINAEISARRARNAVARLRETLL